jgi:hypothetical protein
MNNRNQWREKIESGEVRVQGTPERKPVSYAPLPRSPLDAKAEAPLLGDCEKALRWRGIAYLHISHRAREKKGWPDLVFCFMRDGERWPCAVELKSAKGKLTPEQECMLTLMRVNGWHTYVLRVLGDMVDLLEGRQVDEWGGQGEAK